MLLYKIVSSLLLLLVMANAFAQTPNPESASTGCPDNYGISVRGTNFASNATVDVRAFGSYGAVIDSFSGSAVSTSIEGGQNVLRFVVSNPATMQVLNTQGLWLWVINPSAGTWMGPVAVTRAEPALPTIPVGTTAGSNGYDVLLQGSNYASNASIDVRATGSGVILQSFSGTQITRGCSGDATTLKISITDPTQQNYLNTIGLNFWVINPSAGQFNGPRQVIRSGYAQPPAQLVSLKGGSNYNWYKVDFTGSECDREPYGILKNYHSMTPGGAVSVRSVVQNQLSQMYASGQRTMRVGVYFSRVADTGTVIYAPGALPTQVTTNLTALLQDVKAAGFQEVIVGMFPIGNEYSFWQWGAYNSAYAAEYSSIIQQTRAATVAANIPFLLDLANELMPTTTAPAAWSQAAQTIWSTYVNSYGAATSVGFSSPLVNSGDPASRLANLQRVYGSNIPSVLDVHLYNGGTEGTLLSSVNQVLDQQSVSSQLIIGETNYNDSATAVSLATVIPSANRTVRYLLQWGKSRSASQANSCDGQNVQSPLSDWSNYSSIGF